MIKADARNHIITTGTYQKGEFKASEDASLVGGHAYTVISAHEAEFEDQPLILFKVRNTWGKTEWQGDWSDKSPIWTDELKEKLGHTDKEDGIFFIKNTDYFENFESTSVCIFEDSHKSSWMRTTGEEGRSGREAYFSLNVINPRKDVSFILSQISDKFNGVIEGYEISQAKMVIGRKSKSKSFPWEFVASVHGWSDEDTYWHTDKLEPGEYCIYTTVQFKDPKIYDEWSFRLYSDGQPPITKIDKPDPNFLHQVWGHWAHQNAEMRELDDDKDCRLFGGIHEETGWLIYHFENLSKAKKKMKGVCKLDNYSGLCPPADLLEYNEFVLKPGETKSWAVYGKMDEGVSMQHIQDAVIEE